MMSIILKIWTPSRTRASDRPTTRPCPRRPSETLTQWRCRGWPVVYPRRERVVKLGRAGRNERIVLQVPWPATRWPCRRRTSPSTTGSSTTYSAGSTKYWERTTTRSTCACRHPHTPTPRRRVPRKNPRTKPKSSPEKGNKNARGPNELCGFNAENRSKQKDLLTSRTRLCAPRVATVLVRCQCLLR